MTLPPMRHAKISVPDAASGPVAPSHPGGMAAISPGYHPDPYTDRRVGAVRGDGRQGGRDDWRGAVKPACLDPGQGVASTPFSGGRTSRQIDSPLPLFWCSSKCARSFPVKHQSRGDSPAGWFVGGRAISHPGHARYATGALDQRVRFRRCSVRRTAKPTQSIAGIASLATSPQPPVGRRYVGRCSRRSARSSG